jgi:hypothetical protein
LIWLRTGNSGRLLWTQQRTFRFHTRGEFFDYLSDYQHLKEESAPLAS